MDRDERADLLKQMVKARLDGGMEAALDIALKAAAEKADAMMKEMEKLARESKENSPSRDRLMARALCALYIKEDILALTSKGPNHE